MSEPLLSMTGFGRAMRTLGGVTVEAEIRGVNHRFLDLSLKTPRVYSPYEAEIRALLSEKIGRGRIEVFVMRRATDASTLSVNFNKELYQKLFATYEDAIGVTKGSASEKQAIALNILSRREVLDILEESSGVNNERELLFAAINEALSGFATMRGKEGAHLKGDLLSRLEKVKSIRTQMQAACQKTPLNFKEKLSQRLQKLAPEMSVDPQRLAAEVALMADRIDTTEEFVRLESHFVQFAETLQRGKGTGRRLDFLVQELGREFNTIASKAQDAAVQHLVIEAKAEVERIKEQVQNVE